MIKIAAPTMAQQVIDMAIQMFGGGVPATITSSPQHSRPRLLRWPMADEVHRSQIARLEIRRHAATDPRSTGGSGGDTGTGQRLAALATTGRPQ